MDIKELKDQIKGDIESRRSELSQLSLKIHSNPETGLRETKAAAWLTQYLEENGFSVERGICDLPTAFRASYGRGKPEIALLGEYDALPGVGHACGHNIICTSAVGAGVASRRAVDQFGGTIIVIGTPAEELQGGKAIMANRGGFNGLDAAMIVHPGTHDTATIKALACHTLDVEFFGKAAHAAAQPESGINALEAMINSFTAINSLRQHIKETSRIHGVITDGGKAANVVPDHSAAQFLVRAMEDAYLDELKERVINCFKGAAIASGARLEYRWAEIRYAPMYNNLTLARLFKANMHTLRPKISLFDPREGFGSTDMGNVSQVVPSIHPYVAIAPEEVLAHSPQFAEAAASEAGMRGLVDAARALAMTVVDLLASPETVARARKEFEKTVGK